MMQNNEIKWIKLGTIITQRREKYDGSEDLPIRGVSREGFISPKQKEADFSKYNVFYKDDFVFNPARMELNSIALNTEYPKAICSSLYEIFEIDKSVAIPEYMNLFLKRDEFARQCAYIGSGSAREYCRVGNISEISMPIPFKDGIPDIDKQQELVDTWKGLRNMKEENEAIASPLFSLCQSYIQELKHSCPHKTLYDYIEQCDERNSDNEYAASDVRGLATSKQIIETKANLIGVVLTSYKVLKPCEFAFVSDTSRRADKMSLGYNNSFSTYIVSSISTVFRIKNSNELIPEFLYLWFCRPEFDRYARFHSWGSARETFSFEEMCRVKMPIPSKEIQQAVVDMYNCANDAKKIAEEADILSKNICPALIQHVINNN